MNGRVSHVVFLALSTSAFLLGACDDRSNGTPTTRPSDTRDTTGTETVNPATCKVDNDCAGTITATACRTPKCNQTTKTCEAAAVPDGTTCSTNNACKTAETCSAGTCAGGTTKAKDCGAKVCGTDACGNSCGTCQDGESCTAGTCTAVTTGCGDITPQGCCTADGTLKYCNADDEVDTIACKTEAPNFPNCGWTGSSDVGYDCSYDATSSNVSEFPYLCPGETCPAGGCGDRECGSVCGVSCGADCGDGKVCSAEGKCVASTCGEITDVGCCTGDQAQNKYCDNGRILTIDCPNAGDGSTPFCSWLPDNGYYDCDIAPAADPAASDAAPYLCPNETCATTCDGRECGSACGASCGTCASGTYCTEAGRCEVSPCGTLGYEGCCDGAVTYWCEENQVKSQDCTEAANASDRTCGWIPDDGSGGDFYYCGGDGADPSNTLKLNCSDYTFDNPNAEVDPEAGPEESPEEAAEPAEDAGSQAE